MVEAVQCGNVAAVNGTSGTDDAHQLLHLEPYMLHLNGGSSLTTFT